jgi:hypothetical protein
MTPAQFTGSDAADGFGLTDTSISGETGFSSIRPARLVAALRFVGRLCYLAGMKPRHAAALALVGWFITPMPLRAAGGPIAVPGTADVETWYLMRPATPVMRYRSRSNSSEDWIAVAVGSGPLPAQPLPGWVIVTTFPSQQECEAGLHANPRDRCISADDPRLKKK